MLITPILLALAAGAAGDGQAGDAIVITGRNWAPFISPMGEPFRARSKADDTLRLWFERADGNRDGRVTKAEMVADSDRFFDRLDDNGDGLIDPDEIVRYEWQVAPDIQAGSPRRREYGAPPAPPPKNARKLDLREPLLQGAARYSLLNMPEPVTAADSDFDRDISRSEFHAAAQYRFDLLDTAHRGALDFAALDKIRVKVLADAAKMAKKRARNADEVDLRVATPL